MKKKNFSGWYHQVLEESKIIDSRYPIKGMLVYRGWGMKIIREMSNFLTKLLEENNHEPLFMPVLIPEKLLFKESKHIKGFEEQVFWVTLAGKNKLDEKLALRPTSETPLYEMFKLWVRSHQDLPFKIHHPSAVYRYETKHTRPLIRGREFLWNEGHTALKDEKMVEENFRDIKRIYTQLINGLLCLPFQLNKRPDWDKFPGAKETYAFDTIMSDGKTLQIATWHNLGQTFSKVFELTFENEKGEHSYAYQSSYAPSFGRLIAAILSIHGDDHGLVLPPKIAPIQVIIIPILFKASQKKEILKYAKKIKEKLKEMKMRVEIDESEERPGSKFYYWEMKGVPLRIEVGPKDLKEKKVTLVRRDNFKRTYLKMNEINQIDKILQEMETSLREKAEKYFKKRIFKAKNLEELKKYLGKGIVLTGWCGKMECAEKLDLTGGIFLTGESDKKDSCVICGKKGREIKMAKSY